MCVVCAQGGRFTACEGLAPQSSGPGAGGGGVPGGVLDALLALGSFPSARWNFTAAVGTPVASPGGLGNAVSLTYGFLASLPAEHAGLANFQPLSAAQQAGMRAALAAWSEVARVSFTETSGATADLRIGRADQTSAGFAYYPGFGYSFDGGNIITSVTAQPVAGDIFLANTLGDGFAPGSSNYEVALHEVGHALGLKHPFEGPTTLPAATDNLRYTLMSYTQPANTGVVDVTVSGGSVSWVTGNVHPRTPMLYDIEAAQALYGANTAARAGNDTYGFADGERFLATIWDGGGTDTIDASAQTLRSVISLVDGTFSSIGLRLTTAELRREFPAGAGPAPTPTYDGRDNLAIAFGVVIENAIGGAGDDLITGNTANNQIFGGAGNDSLWGGAGDDTLTGGAGDDHFVLDSAGDVVMELLDGGYDTAWVNSSLAPTIGANIEVIRLFGSGTAVNGSATAEQLVANPGAMSQINGGGGDDVIWGNSFFGLFQSLLQGGAGDDIIRAQDGLSRAVGGAGNDQFVINGLDVSIAELAGEGEDTAWVAINGYTVGANVEIIRLALLASSTRGPDTAAQIVANPTLASSLTGGAGDDTLWGSPFADTMQGGLGNDIFRGQGGDDVMVGGPGSDQYVVFTPGCVITEIDGVAGGADIVYVSFATAGSYTMGASVEEGRLYDAANGLVGNASENLMVGNNAGAASTLSGMGGNDIIFGTPGADTIDGGAGNDTLYSQGGADRFLYGAAGWGQDQVAGFTQGLAKLDFRGSAISFGQLQLVASGANTGVLSGADSILVFNVALTAADFLFA